jgi:predicted transposase YdaD
VTDRVPAQPAPARDFDGLYKTLLARHPRDALKLLCGARLGGQEVVLDGPTELPRQRSLQRDKVFLVRHDDSRPDDVYHVEVQVKRTDDFQERMVAYWAGLALKYGRTDHRIHQVVIWPLGGGYPGSFHRDQARLDYRAVNVPEDLDPDALLAGPLAPLALWSPKAPPDVVERVVDRIAATDDIEERLVQVELSILVGGPLAEQVVTALKGRGMNDILEQTESGRDIARRSMEKGLEKGRVEGREEGRVEGLVNAMSVMLRARFGGIDDLDDLARRLAGGDHDGNIARIIAGAALDDLRRIR